MIIKTVFPGRAIFAGLIICLLAIMTVLAATTGATAEGKSGQQTESSRPERPALTDTPTPTATCVPGIAYSNTSPLPIPDNSTVTSTITVTTAFTISTIEVTNINITHPFPADLDVFLVSPAGTEVELFTDLCGAIAWRSDNTGFNLADNKLAEIGTLCPPGAGNYRPEGLLAAVIGENALGVWRLRVTDDFLPDPGTLNSWGLRFGAGNCPPLTPVATVTPTRTAVPTPPAGTPVLVGHVTWLGRRNQPSAEQQLPITLTLKSAAIEVNFPSRTTDASGFFTVGVGSLPSGTYSWRVKGPDGVVKTQLTDPPGFLANCGAVNLTGAPLTNVEMGPMKAGDSNNDNLVNISDFNFVKASFGKAFGEPGFDNRTDFNGDLIVNIADFNLVKQNFALGGCIALARLP